MKSDSKIWKVLNNANIWAAIGISKYECYSRTFAEIYNGTIKYNNTQPADIKYPKTQYIQWSPLNKSVPVATYATIFITSSTMPVKCKSAMHV